MSTEVGQEGSLIEAIFSAETFKDFKEVDEKILEIVTAPRLEEFTPELPPIGGLNLGSMRISSTDRAGIRKQVIEEIRPFAGELIVKDEAGDYTVNPTKIKSDQSAGELARIISETTDKIAIDIQTGLMNPIDVYKKHIPDAVNLIPKMVTSQTKLTFDNPTSGITSGTSIFDEVVGDRETGTKVN